ncbi:MAG: RdgB/HAM1 family non-canonical purine NTP pyrophosphatase [Anaerolineales bacterium]|nr:RdgB/HAM1 family non-canonical purine NTP pyrophosphatase [Anaerolineales bacterium]
MTNAILIATQNPHKVQEYHDLLTDLKHIKWLSLADIGLGDMEVEETGTTFEQNARLKADAYYQASKMLTLADDSGLVVDYLNGEPGVYSARYGGLKTAEARYELLLDNLKGVPSDRRTARFVCTVAIAAPHQPIQIVRGSVEGWILTKPRGINGFGYDPVFLLPNGKSMAELTTDEKNLMGHRGRALRAALPILQELLGI